MFHGRSAEENAAEDADKKKEAAGAMRGTLPPQGGGELEA